jgi:hypothetical protein
MAFEYFVRPCLILTQVLGAESYLPVTLEHLAANLHFRPLGRAPQRSRIHWDSWVRHATLLPILLYVTIALITPLPDLFCCKVFGGQDSEGNIVSEVWLLRAYAGAVTSPNVTWSGYGNGQLQTGISANGSGVRVQYMSTCASMISNPLPTSSPTSSPPGSSYPPLTSHLYDTSVVHKILAPISLAVFQPIYLLIRLLSPFDNGSGLPIRHISSALFLLVAYTLGIAGLATSFTTISASDPASGRPPYLKTGHGIAGLVLFVCFYGLVPGLFIISLCSKRSHVQNDKHEADRTASRDSREKLDSVAGPSTPHSLHNTSPPSSPRPRTNSWGPSSNLQDGWLSSDTESLGSAGPSRTFEVVNRPRARRTSGSWPIPQGENKSQQPTIRSLGDIDWLQRRRRLNAVVSQELLLPQPVITPFN